MILNFLPSVNYALSPERLNSLRTYTRELREHIESNLVHYPAKFYQKKVDGTRVLIKIENTLSLISIIFIKWLVSLLQNFVDNSLLTLLHMLLPLS